MVHNCTLFENYSKCRIWSFDFWHFPPFFVLLKLTCLVTLFDRKLQIFKNSPKWTILCIFNQLLSTHNVNVARFARNVERDFFCDFQTPCLNTNCLILIWYQGYFKILSVFNNILSGKYVWYGTLLFIISWCYQKNIMMICGRFSGWQILMWGLSTGEDRQNRHVSY